VEERTRLGWIVWLAAVTAAAAATWTVLTYRPTAEQVAEAREESDLAARKLARAIGAGDREVRRMYSSGEFDRALETTNLWLQADAENVEATYWRSYLLAMRSDGASESRRTARRGLELTEAWIDRDPTEPRWHAFSGWFLLLSGNGAGRASVPESDGSSDETGTQARAAFLRAASLLEARDPSQQSPWSREYDLACYLSMAGMLEESIEHLAASVELGRTGSDWLRSDPDLDPIRGQDGYASILVRLQEIRLVREASYVESPTLSDIHASERERQGLTSKGSDSK
jgi:hypothetical protein